MRTALKSHSQDTGILYLNPQVPAPRYKHVEVALRHCDFHPAAAPAASQRSATLSPLCHVHTQVLRTPSACLQAQQTAAGFVLCRLLKNCSLQCETQAPLWEGYPIPKTTPDATLLTHASSQLQFSSRSKRGKGTGMRQYLHGY